MSRHPDCDLCSLIVNMAAFPFSDDADDLQFEPGEILRCVCAAILASPRQRCHIGKPSSTQRFMLLLRRVYDDEEDWFEGENQQGKRGYFPS
jgi:hypothetical protein